MRAVATITIVVRYDEARDLNQVREQAKGTAERLVDIGMAEGMWSGQHEDLSVDHEQPYAIDVQAKAT